MDTITLSIVIYILLCGFIHVIKPYYIYNEDGTFKDFGIGYKKKTVIPIWLCMILIAILTYFFVFMYKHHYSVIV
jgi:hypothetical protein